MPFIILVILSCILTYLLFQELGGQFPLEFWYVYLVMAGLCFGILVVVYCLFLTFLRIIFLFLRKQFVGLKKFDFFNIADTSYDFWVVMGLKKKLKPNIVESEIKQETLGFIPFIAACILLTLFAVYLVPIVSINCSKISNSCTITNNFFFKNEEIINEDTILTYKKEKVHTRPNNSIPANIRICFNEGGTLYPYDITKLDYNKLSQSFDKFLNDKEKMTFQYFHIPKFWILYFVCMILCIFPLFEFSTEDFSEIIRLIKQKRKGNPKRKIKNIFYRIKQLIPFYITKLSYILTVALILAATILILLFYLVIPLLQLIWKI